MMKSGNQAGWVPGPECREALDSESGFESGGAETTAEWCNGSTRVFGAQGWGSNPCSATKLAFSESETGIFGPLAQLALSFVTTGLDRPCRRVKRSPVVALAGEARTSKRKEQTMATTPRRRTEMQKESLPLTQLVQSYDLFNRATGKSPTTVAWYNDRLGTFLRYLGQDSRLADLTVDAARGYIVFLQNRNDRFAANPYIIHKEGKLSSAYINGCVRSLRAFANWLFAEGYTDGNRLQPVKPPKVQKKVMQVLSDEEVQELLGCFDRRDMFGIRNHAMVYTLLDTGLRASELANLKLPDLHLKERFVKVLGKGNKERLVPFGTGAQAALAKWRDEARPQFGDGSDGLFLDSGGNQISVVALQEVIQRAARRARISRATCHLLRHTFATNYLVREVGDPLRLQQILGHTTLDMVRHYVAMASVQQSLIDRRASPMDLILSKSPSGSGHRVQPRRAAKLRLVN